MPGKISPLKPALHHRRRPAFTLVEMLAVMAVIAVMLLATLPALNGLSQGKNRQGAVATLMGVLDHARMMAVSDGLPTYVVFARKTDTGSQVNPKLWGRAYAIFQDVDNVNFNVVQRTPWTYLPNNVAFKMEETPVGSELTTRSITTKQKLGVSDPSFPVSAVALPPGKQTSADVQLPCWKFDGLGALDEKLLAAQASDAAGTTAQQSNDYLRVLLFSGYVNDQGQEISTQTNGGASNKTATLLEEIDVNPVTGRARYIVDPFNNLATPTPSPGNS